MVVAYLRGLLRSQNKYGVLAMSAERVVLEALHAEQLAVSTQAGIDADLAFLPLVTSKSALDIAERASARRQRVLELRLFDIYRVSEQLSGSLKADKKDEISLFQLYQITEKSGIFEALDAHYTADKAKPLI